jgi:hypothetical protein
VQVACRPGQAARADHPEKCPPQVPVRFVHAFSYGNPPPFGNGR